MGKFARQIYQHMSAQKERMRNATKLAREGLDVDFSLKDFVELTLVIVDAFISHLIVPVKCNLTENLK